MTDRKALNDNELEKVAGGVIYKPRNYKSIKLPPMMFPNNEAIDTTTSVENSANTSDTPNFYRLNVRRESVK